MKKLLILIALLCFSSYVHTLFIKDIDPSRLSHTVNAEWAIIGGGPAGITVIGLLLDAGIDPSAIIWVDPEFNIGRIGKYYSTVPANSLTKNFIAYINACNTFSSCPSPAVQHLKTCDPESESLLELIIKPLQEITALLRSKILSLEDSVTRLDFDDSVWHLQTTKLQFTANHVVLATGSRPRTLPYAKDKDLPLDIALDKEKLKQLISDTDTVGVVGDRHSAMLVLKYLYELPATRIINFYRNKPIYWTDPGAENSGLSGVAADWAHDVYENNPPYNLIKIKSSDDTLRVWTPLCTKFICALGFERNPLPLINGQSNVTYNDTTGIIMPRLFGIGIAFPQQYIASNGNIEHKVGIREFIEYAQKVMPLWMQTKESTRHLLPFESLFTIGYLYMQE